MRKLFIYSLATIMIVCVSALALRVVNPAAADGSGAQKVPLLPSVKASCTSASNSGPETCGFAVFNETGAVKETVAGVLMAEVTLQNALPTTTYSVELFQTSTSSGSASKVFDGTLTLFTTDDLGNGNAKVQAPVDPKNPLAFVILTSKGQVPDGYFTKDVTFS